MSVCLVTGGAGFIGSHVADALLDRGHSVVVLDDLSGGFKENVPVRAEFIEGSIVDVRLLERLFQKYQFDYVFHIAAYAAEGLSHFIRRFNYTNNLVGSVNLLNEAVKNDVRCFVFTSSIAVYGTGRLPLREEDVPMPEDPYGIAKAAVESDLKAAHHMFGMPYIIFRPHNVYGERQYIGDKYRNVMGIFMNQVMQKKPLSIFGDGIQTRAFTYIGDVAPYIAAAVDKPEAYNQVFNIGGDQHYTVKELAETVLRVSGSTVGIQYLEERKEVKHAYSDHTKVQAMFGIDRLTSLDEGISRMWSWARQKGVMAARKFKEIEVMKNLPPSWLEG